jgi:LCP family protein required for cell wall assembly
MPSSVENSPNALQAKSHSSTAPRIDQENTASGDGRKRSFTWLKYLGWAIAFGGTTVVSAFVGAVIATSMPLPNWVAKKDAAQPLNLVDLWQSGFRYRVTRPVHILVMGVDLPDPGEAGADQLFSGRSDTMLLVRVDPESGDVDLLSIPRDTQVNIPGEGIAKINHANLAGGPELVAETIQTNLGPVPIDRYVRVSTGALRELVDLLEGVEVMVPQRMVYTDNTQGLKIDLEAGWQTLDGNQAEQFARFRGDTTGDIGRVQRQQMLMKALRERLTHPTVIPQLPQVVRVMMRYIDTNLTLEETLALANVGLEIEPDNLNMVMLPGRFSSPDEYVASYWILDPAATQQVMNTFFELDSVALLSNQDNQAITNLSIAIQNATGEPQIAQDVARYLRREGFRQVYVVSDWSSQLQRTQVIAQRGDLESANILSSILGTGRVVAESTGDLQSELTIRIGRDWLMNPTTVQ